MPRLDLLGWLRRARRRRALRRTARALAVVGVEADARAAVDREVWPWVRI